MDDLKLYVFSGMSESISLFLDASYDTYLIHGLYYIQPLIYPPPLPHLVNMVQSLSLMGGLAVEGETQSLHEKTSLSVRSTGRLDKDIATRNQSRGVHLEKRISDLNRFS